jgi:Flp pilus assembly protein TadG
MITAARRRAPRPAASQTPAPEGRRAGSDRGSAAIIVVVFALTLLVLAGFVVDGGLSIANRERAQDVAEQAARYAAQDLDEDALREGTGEAPINHANCESRVADFVEKIQLTSASIIDQECENLGTNRLAVVIVVQYQPIFASFFSDSFDVRGRAEAEAETG